ncbi:MAG TPA: hypothetical protein VFI71_13070, partial [Pyrinomonadaceae bacterium]|nr:hypothetical protein [Pyrinomonadaceae bacterium]
MADLPRRKFLKTIGSVAVASALPVRVFSTQSQPPSIALFGEPYFPVSYEGEAQLDLLQRVLRDFRVVVLNERDLIAQLDAARFDLLITANGSCFPKRAWSVLLKYLRAGGNWLNIGGVPLMRPVVRAGGKWRMEDPQAAYHKRLGITHSFPVDVNKVTAYKTAPELSSHSAFSDQIKPKQIHELYVRLSSTSNEPDEAGSDGPHEGVVRPLLFAYNEAGRAIAAPIIEIDRWTAEFAGGRWVFANFDGQFDSVALLTMVQRALQGASRFEVKSEFASYQPGEAPSFTVELARKKGDLERLAAGGCQIVIGDSDNMAVSRLQVPLKVEGAKATGSVKLAIREQLKPGFYQVHAVLNSSSQRLSHVSGFWIYDEALLARGKPLTADKHFFYRDGQVFPVTGTTYMASDKHRRYLFEPNPFVWDKDFREMKAAGVNMIRTGIWTGWKKYMTEPGKFSEATLRAFDAFLLTAHKHDIPV